MNFLKAVIVGAVASLVLIIIMMLLVGNQLAPFNTPPSAAFSMKIGLPAQPTGAILHFLYGILLSVIFVYLFRETMSFWKGIGFAIVIWLIMMIVFSPIIGWGFFGYAAGLREPTDPFYLASTGQYLLATLILHLIYGAIIGWLNPWWIKFESEF